MNHLVNIWGNKPNRQFSKEEIKAANKYMEKMLNILSHEENANQLTFHLASVSMTVVKKTNSRC